jgi:hypothetical protein
MAPAALSAGVWYQAVITLQASSVIAGNYDPVIFKTTSSLDAKRIIYDYNNAYAHVVVAPAPTASALTAYNLLVSTAATIQAFGAQYYIYIDFTPKLGTNVTITSGANYFV